MLLAGTLGLAVMGCVETGSSTNGDSGDQDSSSQISDVLVAFDPENQVIPFPNNLLFEAGAEALSDLDGTLNAPVDNDDDSSSADLVRALNSLDGFSTIEPWRLEFTGAIDADSLREHVRVFRMESAGENYPQRIEPTGVAEELEEGRDFLAEYRQGIADDGSESHLLKIIPKRPLDYGTTYVAVVEEGLVDMSNQEIASPLTWAIAKGRGDLDQCRTEDGKPNLERSDAAMLQCMTNLVLDPIEADIGIDRNDMLMAWGVTTQREDVAFWHTADHMRNVLSEVKTAYDGGVFGERELQMANFLDVDSTGEEVPTTPGEKAIVWPGAVRLPVALPEPEGVTPEGDTVTEKPLALTDHWHCMPEPEINLMDSIIETSDESLPCTSDAARSNGYIAGYPVPTLDEFANEDQRFQSLQTVPAILTVPDKETPDGGFPVVIYQHAIQQNRSNVLAVADELAEQGFAALAIDMPLHGMNLADLQSLPEDHPQAALVGLHAVSLNQSLKDLEDADDSFITSVENLFKTVYERTYYLDLNGDGKVDPSGEHFLMPDAPLSQRDIMRQGAMDLVTLAHYLRDDLYAETCVEGGLGWGLINLIAGTGCSDTALNDRLNTDEIHYVGHSVGNILAAPFLTYDEHIASVTMLAPTGGIMRTLENSESIGPQLSEGLAEAGLQQGQEDYFRFFSVVQAALDSVEPLNHAPAIGQGVDGKRPVYMAQIVGNDGSSGFQPSDADLVLPPSVDTWPLAGSTPLADAIGLEHKPSDEELGQGGGLIIGDEGTPLQARVSYRYGDHASFLLTLDDLDDRGGKVAGFGEADSDYETHHEMQQQVGSFLGSGGTTLDILAPDLIEGR